MKPIIPDDLFHAPTVTLPSGVAADALHTLAVDADFLRRLAHLIQTHAGFYGHFTLDSLAARVIAGDIDATAARLEHTYTALDLGRVTPADADAMEN